MAAAALSKFIKGLDLEHQDLSVGVSLSQLGDMTNLEWIRLDRTNIDEVPDELFKLNKLKKLSLSHNLVCSLAAL